MSKCNGMSGGKKRYSRKSRRHQRKSAKKLNGGYLDALGRTLYTAAVPFGLYGAQKSLHRSMTRKNKHRRNRH